MTSLAKHLNRIIHTIFFFCSCVCVCVRVRARTRMPACVRACMWVAYSGCSVVSSCQHAHRSSHFPTVYKKLGYLIHYSGIRGGGGVYHRYSYCCKNTEIQLHEMSRLLVPGMDTGNYGLLCSQVKM